MIVAEPLATPFSVIEEPVVALIEAIKLFVVVQVSVLVVALLGETVAFYVVLPPTEIEAVVLSKITLVTGMFVVTPEVQTSVDGLA